MRATCETARRRRPPEGGFSLLELTISMAVLLVVAVGVAQVAGYAAHHGRAAAARAQTLSVANAQMEALRAAPFDDPLLEPSANPARPARAEVTAGGSRFVVTRAVLAENFVSPGGGAAARPATKLVTVAVTPVVANAPWAAAAVTVTARRADTRRGPH